MFDFKNLPLNTQQCYTMATDLSGTKIFVPVDSRDDTEINKVKKSLQSFLYLQEPPPKEAA